MAVHKTQEARMFGMLVMTRREGESLVLEFGKELLEGTKEKASPYWDNIERM